ncbi:MAG: porin [Alphaproteobacteria bacterium]|nr:porin [Alphaproteobacteria bacterium]
MSGNRTIKAIAGKAIAGLALSTALLLGVVSVRADELSDLRANQQLLQQRIDQLAAAVNNNGAPQQQAQVTGPFTGASRGTPVVAGAPTIAGSFPRSFLVPGTNTSIAITGFVKYDMIEKFRGSGVEVTSGSNSINGNAATGGLPLNLKGPPGSLTAAPFFNPAKRQNWVYTDDASFSRLRIETRTPTNLGEVGTVFEMDFAGCTVDSAICSKVTSTTDSQLMRLRYAYATIGGFIAGQAKPAITDNDAAPELFDDGGEAGLLGPARLPLIGYTWQLPYGVAFTTEAVTPESSFWTPIGGFTDSCNPATGSNPSPVGVNIPPNPPVGISTSSGISNCPPGVPGGLAINPMKSNLPEGQFTLRAEQPWGHVQGSFVVHRLTLQDGAFLNQNFAGYGGGVSGNMRPNWFGFSSKDNFGFNGWAGTGLGHDANPPGGTEPTTANALQSNFGLVGAFCNRATGAGCYGNSNANLGTTANSPTAGNTLPNSRLVRTSTVGSWGTEFNYQHWWLDTLRSTLSFGIQMYNLDGNLLGHNATTLTYNRIMAGGHANLIWSPVSFIDTGFETFLAQRTTLLHQRGQLVLLDYSIRVKF